MADGGSGVRIIQAAEGWAIGEIANCLAIVWRHQPTVDVFRFRNTQLQELAKRAPAKCALVEVIEPTSKPPTDEMRKVAMEVFRQLGGDLGGIGFVLEGNELKSTLNRAILTGMMFFVKQLQPTKVFKRSSELATWARARVASEDPAFETKLVAAFEELRRLIGPGQR